MLSIDIGKKNLGYAYMRNEDLSFGIYNLDKSVKQIRGTDTCLTRCKVLAEWLNTFDYDTIIIEKQFPSNVVCMSCMYALVALNLHKRIIIFDPRKKFSDGYSTEKKQHKRLSVQMVKKWLEENANKLLDLFNSYKKQDDIADALLMLILTKS